MEETLISKSSLFLLLNSLNIINLDIRDSGNEQSSEKKVTLQA